MNAFGGLLLVVSIGLLLVVGIPTIQDMLGEATASNDTAIQNAANGGSSATGTIFIALGFVALIGGAMIAINAFR